MTPSLPVRIASLGPGVHTLRLTPEAASLGLDPSEFRDLDVAVRFDVGTGQIVATLDASATAMLVCDRTAQPFDQRVNGTYTVLFTQDAAMAAEGSEDVRVYGPYDASLDLGDVVHDTLLLALPHRRLAPGAEALDVPLRFGGDPADDAPADDRWEALRRLRDDGALN